MPDLASKTKKGWKAFQADYDYVFSLRTRECMYCLSDQQVAALLAMTEYLKWPTRWHQNEGEIDLDLINSFADYLERNLMSGCCDDNIPIQYRYSPDGVLQRSENGGGIFTDAPEYDPRNYSTQFPPIEGADGPDKKCLAATGASALIKEQVGDQLTDEMSRYTLSELITDWVGTMIQSSNPFQALLTVITNQIFALVIAALRPALTTAVYDILTCILYCAMSADASFTSAQWAKVRSDITAQIGGIAGIFLEHLVFLLGITGLTNLVRAGGAAEGDCSGCTECLECAALWSIFGDDPTHYHGEILSVGENFITARTGVTGGNKYLLLRTPDAGQCCVVSSIEVLSGDFSGGLTGWTDCGTTPSEGAPQHTGLLGDAVCINYLQLQSTAAICEFKITFADCP